MTSRRDASIRGAPRKAPPHEFVLEALAPASPVTRPMFGCLAVYVKERIVLILRDSRQQVGDNGVWLATTAEHHDSLRREFPRMRSIRLMGRRVTSWQLLPADAGDFEESAMHACELVLARDPRIGTVPAPRRMITGKTKTKAKTARRPHRRRQAPRP